MDTEWYRCRLLFLIDCIVSTITMLSKLSSIIKLSKNTINGKNAFASLLKMVLLPCLHCPWTVEAGGWYDFSEHGEINCYQFHHYAGIM